MLARVHRKRPDEVVQFLRQNIKLHDVDSKAAESSLRLGEGSLSERSLEAHESIHNVAERLKAYQGRCLQVGDIVFTKVSYRGRKKEDPYWSEPVRVTARIGTKTYEVFDGKRVTSRNIDTLKSVGLHDSLAKTWAIGPEVLKLAETKLGKVEDCDLVFPNISSEQEANFKDRVIWIGYPGLKNLDAVVDKLAQMEYKVAYIIVPELICCRWYDKLEKLGSSWYGVDPDDDVDFWVDIKGKPVGSPFLTWWIVKVVGRP
jgi:hypothetical protein